MKISIEKLILNIVVALSLIECSNEQGYQYYHKVNGIKYLKTPPLRSIKNSRDVFLPSVNDDYDIPTTIKYKGKIGKALDIRPPLLSHQASSHVLDSFNETHHTDTNPKTVENNKNENPTTTTTH